MTPLHLHEWGDPDKPAVVCLHGVVDHGGSYERLARERLGAYRVVAPDLRGHGSSPFEPPWSLEQHLEDLAGLPAGAWIGHSFGGRLAFEVAAREPERVERLVLLDPALRIQGPNALRLAEEARLGRPTETPVSFSAVIAAFGEMSRRPPAYDRIRCPVLLIRGLHESVMGPNRLRAFEEALGDQARVVHVPAGHDVLPEAFEETADAIAEFLALPA